jgi:hypothetical protein
MQNFSFEKIQFYQAADCQAGLFYVIFLQKYRPPYVIPNLD